MPRTRVIYNCLGLFAGPAPSSGYHFIDNVGNLNGNVITGVPGNLNHNLLQNIYRVQNVSYSLPLERHDVAELGKKSFLHRGTKPAPITLNFEYLQNGILNELRLGFNSNFARYFADFNGSPFYADNFQQTALDGFFSRSDERLPTEFSWPMRYRDKKNLFVVVGRETDGDLKKNYANYVSIDPAATEFANYAFGDAYISSYRSTATIGDFPKASVGYICDNLVYNISGSGVKFPSVNPRDKTVHQNQGVDIKFAIPSLHEVTGFLSVLRPGDITLDFVSLPRLTGFFATYRGYSGVARPNETNINNLGVSFPDIKIQNYSIDLTFNRRDKHQIGYHLPIDRVIENPVVANFTFGAVLGDGQSGSFMELLNRNDDYNITIKLKNPPNYASFGGMTAIQYDFKRAKFSSINYEASIGTEKKVDVSFSCEIDDQDLSKGMFMSGLFNLPLDYVTSTALLAQDGSNILFQNNTNIIANQINNARPMF